MKKLNNQNRDEIETRIRHIDRKLWNFVKSLLETEYGTYYAHIGDFVNQALRHYIECVIGIDPDNPTAKTSSLQKTKDAPIRTKRKNIIRKICKELLNIPEDMPLSGRGIREIIQRVFEEETGLPPARSTVYNYFNYIRDYYAVRRNPYSNEFYVDHSRVKLILQRLENSGKS